MLKGAFKVPDQEPGKLHLYRVDGKPGSRSGITRDGSPYAEFAVDLFDDEDEVYVCDVCKRKTDAGWLHAGSTVACQKCAVPHAGPFEPCVLFHKFSRRCWSEEMSDVKPGLAWTDVREKATVYPDRRAAQDNLDSFLPVVQKAILIVPVGDFDGVLAKYRENV